MNGRVKDRSGPGILVTSDTGDRRVPAPHASAEKMGAAAWAYHQAYTYSTNHMVMGVLTRRVEFGKPLVPTAYGAKCGWVNPKPRQRGEN